MKPAQPPQEAARGSSSIADVGGSDHQKGTGRSGHNPKAAKQRENLYKPRFSVSVYSTCSPGHADEEEDALVSQLRKRVSDLMEQLSGSGEKRLKMPTMNLGLNKKAPAPATVKGYEAFHMHNQLRAGQAVRH
eukprot:390164-Amphidinium_carterae.3